MNTTFKSVPNYDVGRGDWVPDCIVIHIAEGSKNSVYQQFNNQAAEVSSHYLVNKDGTVWQFVTETNTAWCNGGVHSPTSKLVLSRPGVNPNAYTISIEHEGYAAEGDMSDLMYATTVELVKNIASRWNIPLDGDHVIRHRDITALKGCPGPISVERIIQAAKGTSLPVQPVSVPTAPADTKSLKALLQALQALITKLLATL